MGHSARLLDGGQRLHLQHGPIDLIIGADGERQAAFETACARFENILPELMTEIHLLRRKATVPSAPVVGRTACRMRAAVEPYAAKCFVTPMAAVAGAVADEVLSAMVTQVRLSRAYVNNGGDCALHLAAGTSFATAMQGHDGSDLGRIDIMAGHGIGGLATSGRHGRSHSLGIADSVTVLAETAAAADAAATMIANRVDLPGHPAIQRQPAEALDDMTDLGNLPVVTSCAALSPQDCALALHRGANFAKDLMASGHIVAASLHLQGHSTQVGTVPFFKLERKHHCA